MTNPPLPEIQTVLQSICAQVFPEIRHLRVENLNPLNTGWESIIYRFELHSDPRPPQLLILRLYPGADAAEKSLREFTGMQTLRQLGYPVPQVYHLQRDGSPFAKPFLLMEHISGEILWHALNRAAPERAAVLLDRFSGLLADLHALDWMPFAPETERKLPTDPFAPVDGFFALIRGATVNFPNLRGFEPITDWLTTRREYVPCPRPAPVHWDFHPNNVILRPDGGLVVIDWTQIQASDPRFDLGWTLLLAYAYNGQAVRDQILAAYQRHTGREVEQLAFFEVANALKRLGSVLISLSAGAEQMGMRPDAGANMRADFPSLRRVYDLLVARTGLRLPEVEKLLST